MATRANKLAQLLAGKNLTISNASISCDSLAAAKFKASKRNIVGLDSGIVLSTGKTKSTYSCSPPNPIWCLDDVGIDLPSSYFSSSGGSILKTFDTLLAKIIGLDSQYNRCLLEFDIVPLGDTIRFNYVFATEEYPDYSCSNLNDVFGLFISGPGIVGHKNIATLPNSTIPVCINSVFDTVLGYMAGGGAVIKFKNCSKYGIGAPFTQYFVKNDTGSYLIFNGMTVAMTAMSPVIPLSTYHLIFNVADIQDGAYDSGVFIEAGSLKSTSMVYATPYSTGGQRARLPYMIESCGNVRINFRTPKKLTGAMTIGLSYGGSAIFGVDYDSALTSFVIPNGDSTYDLYLNPKIDALTELSDSIIIYATNGTTYFDTIVYKVYDKFGGISVFNNSNDTLVCNRSKATLYVNSKDSMLYNLKWTPSTYLNDSTSRTPICTPNVPSTLDSLIYSVNISHPSCPPALDSIVKIYIKHTPNLSMIKDTLLCKGDTFKFNPVINPTGTYTYSWSPSTALSNASIFNPKATPNSTTKYVFTINVPNGCKVKDSTILNVYNIKPNLDSIRWINPDCHGINGKISVYLKSADTNLRFKRNNLSYQSSGLFTNLIDTIHKISISYKYQCKLDTSISLTKIRPDIQFIETLPTCNNANGQILANVIKARQPILYEWSNGGNSNIIFGLISGFYTLTITDSLGCKDTLTTNLKALDAPSFDLEQKDAFCTNDNGKLKIKNLTGKKPLSIQWSTGSTIDSIVNLSSGTYSITVTDGLGCTLINNYTISFFNSPSIAYSAKPVTCNTDKGTISLNITQGKSPYSYLCSNGSVLPNISNLSGNRTYKVKVTDANNCSDSANIFIDSIIKLSSTLLVDSSYCSLGNGNIYSSTINGSFPFQYNWSNGNSTKDNLNINSGIYSLTITDKYNCSEQLQTNVWNSNPNFINKTSKVDLICYKKPNGSITLNISGGKPAYQYNFNNLGFSTNSVYSNLFAGKYIYFIRDSKNCILKDSILLFEPSELKIDKVNIMNASCFASQDGSINIEPIGGTSPYTYIWSNLNTTKLINNIKRGSYSVTVTDNNNCQFTNRYLVNSPDSFKIKSIIQHHKCYNDSSGKISLEILGGNTPYTYKWSNQATSLNLSNLIQGNYILTLTDSKNCTDIYQYEIKTPRLLKFDEILVKSPRCHRDYNGSIKLIVSGGTEYGYKYENKDNSTIQQNGLFSYLDSGKYSFHVEDLNGCFIDTIIEILDPIKTEIEILPQDTSILIGESYSMTFNFIKGNKSIDKLIWSPSEGLSCSDCKTPQVTTYVTKEYNLVITDTNGCISKAKSNVFIRDSLVLYIPNAFSPNNDQINDEFKVYGKYIVSATLSIYNRWGEKVFETNDAMNKGWNGKYKGQLVPQGEYSYISRISTLSRQFIDKSGSLLLVY